VVPWSRTPQDDNGLVILSCGGMGRSGAAALRGLGRNGPLRKAGPTGARRCFRSRKEGFLTPRTSFRMTGLVFAQTRWCGLEFLVVGVGGGYYQIFGFGVDYGLLGVVGPVGEGGHYDVESDGVFGFVQVGVYVNGDDLLGGGVEFDGHAIAGLGVIGEDEIHCAGGWIQREVAGGVGVLHTLRVGRDVEREKAFHLAHVALNFSFFLFDDSLLQATAAGFLRGRTDRSFLNLAIGTVLAEAALRLFGVSL
jgi:hypothetical protein